jgi:hypothetical protein
VALFGMAEYALRAIPLAAGVISVFAMGLLAKRMFRSPLAQFLALGLFAFSGALIFYSVTEKPYAVDVLTTLILYAVALGAINNRDVRSRSILAVVGAAAIWFSFAAVFVLAGIGVALMCWDGLERRWRDLVGDSATAGAWIVSFAVLYVVSVSDLHHLQQSIASSTTGGIGETPGSGVLRTLLGALRANLGVGHFHIGGHDVGDLVVVLAAVLAAVGFVVFIRTQASLAVALVAPAVFVVAASQLGDYPLFPRTLLFLTPAAIVLISAGTSELVAQPRLRAAGLAGVTVLFVSIAVPTVRHVADPQQTSDLKPALRFLAQHERPGDTLWIYHATQYGFRYYVECKCFASAHVVRRAELFWPVVPAPGGPDQFAPTLRSVPPRLIVSRSIGDSTRYRSELAALRGRRRVWLLVSDASRSVRAPIFAFANRIGPARVQFKASQRPDTAVTALFDFGR